MLASVHFMGVDCKMVSWNADFKVLSDEFKVKINI